MILVGKFADHLPLNRQSAAFAREGIELDTSTLIATSKICSRSAVWMSPTKRCGDGFSSSGHCSPENFAADARGQHRGGISMRWS